MEGCEANGKQRFPFAASRPCSWIAGEIMNVQTIEIAGGRFVILPEPDFREMERRLLAKDQASVAGAPREKPTFDSVVPFDVSGESASEMLVRERR